MKKFVSLLALTVIALSLAACGAAGPTTQIDITLRDFQFTPGRFTVPAGSEITVTATHTGAVVHDFLVMKLGTDVGHAFDESDRANVYWELKAEPGETKSGSFIAPLEPGEYQILCGTPGHLEAGMIGTLTVVAAQ